MYPTLLQIGPFTLHSYGFFVALGFLAGYFLVRKEMDKRGLSMELTDQLFFFVIVAGTIGARFFYFGAVKFVLGICGLSRKSRNGTFQMLAYVSH